MASKKRLLEIAHNEVCDATERVEFSDLLWVYDELSDAELHELYDLIIGWTIPEVSLPDREEHWWPTGPLGNISKADDGQVRIQSFHFREDELILTKDQAINLANILISVATA